jgi:CyaY protein
MTTTSDTMDEGTFQGLAHDAMERVQRGLDAFDPDVVEPVLESGVLKLVFASGPPFVLNTQRPLREVWLAADRQAWHFRYDGARWVDKKGGGDELFATVGALVAKKTGLPIAL